MNIAALIPAYQPDEKLIELLKNLRDNTEYSVFVVNDGSKKECDGIFEEAKEYATVLVHEVNRGKGAAIKTGLDYILKNTSCDGVVTLDSDGQHTLNDTTRVVCELEKNPNALIIGGRLFSGKVPLRSKFGNSVTRGVFKLSTGVSVHDTQTGLRAFSRELMPMMVELKGDRYEYEMNVLLDCTEKGIQIVEIPIETIYIEENRSSHFNPLKDSFKIYKLIIKFGAPTLLLFVLASVLSWLIDAGLYHLLLILFGNIESNPGFICQIFDATICHVIARVVSAPLNYLFNKFIVFKSKGKMAQYFLQYCLLAASILIASTAIISIVENSVPVTSGFAPYVKYVKHIVDGAMFIVSWFVQRFLIFKKKNQI